MTRDATLVDVGVDLGPLSNDGFPTVWGIGAVAAALTAAAPWLSRCVAAGRVGPAASG